MPSDLPFQSLTELARRLARGETTSRALVDACLARIAALDGKLHAFVDVYRDDALKLADAADLERSVHASRGPLHGLPIALKDLLEIKGRQTTAGAKSWLGRRSDFTATAVTRLVAAGMIPLGQDAHGGVRVRRLGPQRADGRAVEPVGPDDPSRRGRLVERLRGRGRGGPRAGRASGRTPAARCGFLPRSAD